MIEDDGFRQIYLFPEPAEQCTPGRQFFKGMGCKVGGPLGAHRSSGSTAVGNQADGWTVLTPSCRYLKQGVPMRTIW